MPPKHNKKKIDCKFFPTCRNYNCPYIHKPNGKWLVEVGHHIKITSEDVETLGKGEVYARVTEIKKERNQILCTVKLFPSSLALLTNQCRDDFVTENGEIEVPLSALNYVENLPSHLIEESKTLNRPKVEHIINTAVSVISDFASDSEIDESEQEADVLEKKCFRDFALEFQDFSDEDKFKCINDLIETSSNEVIIKTNNKTTEYKNNIEKHLSRANVAQTAPVVETAPVPASVPASVAVASLIANIPPGTLEEVVADSSVREILANALGVQNQFQAFQQEIQALQEELRRQSENFHRQSEFLRNSENVRYELERQLNEQSEQLYHQSAQLYHQQALIQNQAVEMDNLESCSGGEGSDYLGSEVDLDDVETTVVEVPVCLSWISEYGCSLGRLCKFAHPRVSGLLST